MKRIKNASSSGKFRVGCNIRKWRNLKDVKQKDLAMALNISEAAISNIENDITNITVGQLEDISIALNLSIEQLLADPQDKCRAYMSYGHVIAQQDEHKAMEKELLNAVISSLEKKDQQLQVIMQHFLHTVNELLAHDKPLFNASKQVTSRA